MIFFHIRKFCQHHNKLTAHDPDLNVSFSVVGNRTTPELFQDLFGGSSRLNHPADACQRRSVHEVKVDLSCDLTTFVYRVNDERLASPTICNENQGAGLCSSQFIIKWELNDTYTDIKLLKSCNCLRIKEVLTLRSLASLEIRPYVPILHSSKG